MLEKILKINSSVNRKYVTSYLISATAADVLSQYVLPNLLYGNVSDENTVLITIAAKTIPFAAFNIVQYWNSPKRNKVIASQIIGAAITGAIGYPLFKYTLANNVLPRPVAGAVLHAAATLSFLTRTAIDRYNGVHEIGPNPGSLFDRVKARYKSSPSV